MNATTSGGGLWTIGEQEVRAAGRNSSVPRVKQSEKKIQGPAKRNGREEKAERAVVKQVKLDEFPRLSRLSTLRKEVYLSKIKETRSNHQTLLARAYPPGPRAWLGLLLASRVGLSARLVPCQHVTAFGTARRHEYCFFILFFCFTY